MNNPIFTLHKVCKRYPYFSLENVSLTLEPGQIMGFVGPNGAGKSTTIRILLGMLGQDSGEVNLLGHSMPENQAAAKADIGFVSDDMSLIRTTNLDWHIRFMRSLYPGWDDDYAHDLLQRFHLNPLQPVKGFSHGQRVKALLLLALARRPRLLILDEPTSGLDPVARHEILSELMAVMADETRSVLFSSHNTADVEQISDQICFVDRGHIIDCSDKESFLEKWRRIKLDLPENRQLPEAAGLIDITLDGRIATVTCNEFTPATLEALQQQGAIIYNVQRMSLEEIFIATVMHSRKTGS